MNAGIYYIVTPEVIQGPILLSSRGPSHPHKFRVLRFQSARREKARAREWQCDGVSPECGLRHLCPQSVGKNSVTRSRLTARKTRKFHIAMCPGERGRRFDEYLASLCHICQRHNVLILDPRVRCRVKSLAWGWLPSRSYND